MSHAFHPRWPNGDRSTMMLDDGDRALVETWPRQVGLSITVKDQLTKKIWLVERAPCGLPRCNCDAVVVREVKPA